jgi:TolA-binding protein
MDSAKERYLETAKRYSQRDVASDALLRVAAIQTVQKDIGAAVATYSLVLNEFTNVLVTAQAYMGRGRAYYNKYQFELAMQDFAAVAETAPTRVDEARYYQILCLYGLGREPDALKAAEKYIIDFPSSSFFPDMLLWIGKFHFNRNDFAAAVKYFNKYVEGFPNRKWADTALLWSARALNNQGDFSAAIETITRFVKNYPDSARLSEARFVQATALIELARFDAAILLLDSVIESASESRWKQMAMLHKGNCLFALGAGNPLRYEEALAVYTAISQSGEQPSAVLIEIFYKIGRCLEKLERFDEAVDCYYSQVLLRYQRDNAAGTWYDEATLSLVMRAAFSAAEIFEKQGQYEQAIGILEKIVKSGSGAADEAQRRIGVINKIKD